MAEGILANSAPEVPVDAPEVPQSVTTPPDGTPPVDAPVRPEYVPENFWNAEKGEVNIEGLTKSYADLRKAFNDKNNDKPGEDAAGYAAAEFFDEAGNFKSEVMPVGKDDPGLQAAYAAAKELGMGVKQTNAFIAKFMDGMKAHMPVPIDIEAELKSLGDSAESRVSGIKTWVDGMQKSGELSPDVYAAILDLGKTAAGIKALDVLRSKTGEMSPPIGEALSGSAHMSLADWYGAKFETHGEAGESRAAYNQRMSDLGKKLIGTGHGTFDGSGYQIGRR